MVSTLKRGLRKIGLESKQKVWGSVWLDPGEEQRGREVGLVYQICWLCASGWSGRGVISMEQLSRAIEVDFF